MVIGSAMTSRLLAMAIRVLVLANLVLAGSLAFTQREIRSAADDGAPGAADDGAARLSGLLGHAAHALERQTERPPPQWIPEEACNQAGGICMPENECPTGRLNKYGLCPKQKAKECCNGLSVLETSCAKRGGQCMPSTSRCVHDKGAKDCLDGESCCILVAL